MKRAMRRVLLFTLALGLVYPATFAQQSQSPDQNAQPSGDSKSQKTADQKSTTQKSDTKTKDSSSSSTQDNRPASERFPFPGDQPGQQTSDQTNSGNSLPNSPTDNRPASERFPFPGDQPNQQNNTDHNRPASEKFPFPGDAPTAPPRSDPRGPNDSSSKDRNVDISPPPDDYKHEGSDLVGPDPAPGVVEMKPWNPHQADKDVEVGMFYFREKNYTAAESRFREALYWQDNHAEATYRLATVLEKQGKLPEAKFYYQQYLKILPNGDLAKDAKKGLARVGGETSNKAENKTPIARP